MTAGARPGLMNLYRDFGKEISFVSVYVREAHPGENYPHHTSDSGKMQQAQDWKEQDKIPWLVAVDTLDGEVHRKFQPLPNSVHLIDCAGNVVFRALWAGQEKWLRRKLEEFLRRQQAGEQAIVLGEQEHLVIPLLHGAAEVDHAVARGGAKSTEDFRRAMGNVVYGFEKLMSKMEPIVNPGNKDIE